MRLLRVVLTFAALALPAGHRARWREESLAVLTAVHGLRRWWFALDMMVKAPLLAGALRRPVTPPGRWLSVLAGAGLIATSVTAVAALALPPVIGEDAAELLFLLSPCGLLGVVAARSVATARSYGGGPLPYLTAATVTVFAGTGPVAAGALSVATGVTAIAMAGAVVPGLWLLTVNATALARRSGPPALALAGVLAGAGLLGVLVGLQLVTHVPAARGVASPVTALSLALLVPAWTVWSLWNGMRLIRLGHTPGV
ncbi:hypothetical protein AB0G04_04915 [Actinoplanes sp. NPDC023801]|uniref:hypothetical protein n=1 Tax=Actinoplanes sp. NPDC023801 TaxID=3154595 RepID=UPI003407A08E